MPTITPSPPGTIDGVSYDSVRYVYDTSGLGVVTDVLYYQGGQQVLDRQLFSFATEPELHLQYGDRKVLPNGDFTLTVTGFHDVDGYEVNTYAGSTSATAVAGELIRTDIYGYSSTGAGVPVGFHDVIQEAGAGSSGQIDGAYFDTVMTVYDDSTGKIAAKDWYNTTNGPIDHSTPVAMQSFDSSGGYTLYVGSVLREQKTTGITGQPYVSELDQYDASGVLTSRTYYTSSGSVYTPGSSSSADLSITLPAGANVGAGHGVSLGTIAIVDPWAASHAGSMALTVSVAEGSLTMSGASGSGKSLHVTGSLSQLNADLATLDYTGAAAGTDQLEISVWNQAGIHVTKDLPISVSGSTATPPPALSPNDLKIATPSTLGVAANGTSPIAGIAIDDAWAGAHAGSLALNISAGAGRLTMTGATATAASLHVSGTLAQLNADLQTLVYHAPAGGSDAITVSVWNQAGINVVGVIHETTTI